MTQLDFLPSETLSHILHCAAECGLSSLLALAATSQRLHAIYTVHQLPLLQLALDASYGPLEDVIQLVTHNASQPAHLVRAAPLSYALMKTIIDVGRIAKRWEEIYPFKKWQGANSVHRRLLNAKERRALRRAIYRIWLYSKAFHTPKFSRFTRRIPQIQILRAKLLYGWTVTDLAEIMDVHAILRKVLAENVCPSNARVQKKVEARYGEEYASSLFFGNQAISMVSQTQSNGSTYYQHLPPSQPDSRYMIGIHHDPALEAYGDDIRYANRPKHMIRLKLIQHHSHYYRIADMLKLDPSHILHLYEHTSNKASVEAYVNSVTRCHDRIYVNPDWFKDNGESLGESIHNILAERGVDVREVQCDLDEGLVGVALVDVNA